MQHLANLAEDNSYPAKEINTFASWYNVDSSCIPLMVCLSLKVLQPAKLLSKTFQKEIVDMVDVINYLSQMKKQLEKTERKNF